MISLRDQPRRELGGPDPLDQRLGQPPLSAQAWLRSLLFTRSALGLAPSLTPAVIFLPMGALLGPRGIGWFTPQVLLRLDIFVTITLAVLGVLVGIAVGREVRASMRLLVAASLESAVTVAAVAGATILFVRSAGVPLDAGAVIAFGLAFGLCASASSATSAPPDSEAAASVATKVADLDDVLPIAATTVIFAVVAPAETAWLYAIAPVGLGLIVGVIGWLLFDRAESGAERVVFVLGTLALAGGAASYLKVSPLAAGLVAGVFWATTRGRADQIVTNDVQRVQHPLIVLLLLTAGALWTPSQAALWLLAPYLLFRLVGKIAGAWVTARFLEVRTSDLAAFLMPPGVLAVAFALNFRQVLPPATGEILVSTVAMGTAAFELFALAVVPHWRRRRN